MGQQQPSPNDGLDHVTTWDAGSSRQEQCVYEATGESVLRHSTSSSAMTMTVYTFGLEEHQYSEASVTAGNTYSSSLAGSCQGRGW